jgi:hypothetical protein
MQLKKKMPGAFWNFILMECSKTFIKYVRLCVCLNLEILFLAMVPTLSSLINYKQELELKQIDRGDSYFTLQPHSTPVLVSKSGNGILF